MKTENNIRVKLFRIEGDYAPFVWVDYMDQDAQVHTGLFLLDSGSTENILSPEIAGGIESLRTVEGEAKTISSISQVVMHANQVWFSFVMGDNQFDETFCVCDEPLPINIKDVTVIGILGNPFLQQHRLVIDYQDHTLHTSEVSRDNFSSADCDFLFPMEIGLKLYGVPVVPVKQNGVELVTLLDTGASNNIISKQALMDCEFKYERMNSKDVMMGIAGNVDADDAMVWFNILSFYGEDDVTELSRCAHFKVLPHNIFTYPEGTCDTNGEQLPPIAVLLGAPFMAKEGWILDFGAKIIYKPKVSA